MRPLTTKMKEKTLKPLPLKEVWAIYAHGIFLGKLYLNERAAWTYAQPGETVVHFREVR